MAKTKTLISFVDSAKLISAFVFAYAKRWFSHDAAQLLNDHHLDASRESLFYRLRGFRISPT